MIRGFVAVASPNPAALGVVFATVINPLHLGELEVANGNVDKSFTTEDCSGQLLDERYWTKFVRGGLQLPRTARQGSPI